MTVVSASFFILTSLVDPCPVIIQPSADANPNAALSPADVSPVAFNVPAAVMSLAALNVPAMFRSVSASTTAAPLPAPSK